VRNRDPDVERRKVADIADVAKIPDLFAFVPPDGREIEL
jgi:hypothetical protein